MKCCDKRISLIIAHFYLNLYLFLFRNAIVGNVVKVRSNQEGIKSNMKTGGEIIESRMEKEGDTTGYNVETKVNFTKKCLHSVETKEKGK